MQHAPVSRQASQQEAGRRRPSSSTSSHPSSRGGTAGPPPNPGRRRPRGCLAPIEPGMKFWSERDYIYVLLQATMQPQSYMLGGMGLALGLRWQAILVAVFLSSLIVMLAMMLTCHPTSSYGIPMPVVARSTFGWFGSKVYSALFVALAVPWSGWLMGVAAKGLYTGLVGFLSEEWLHWDPFDFQDLPVEVDFIMAALLAALFLLQMLFFLPGDQANIIRGFAPSVGMFSLSFYISLLVWAYQRPGIRASLQLLNELREPGPSFYVAFPMMVAAGVCCWGTLILGIPDLARYAPRSRVVKRGIAIMLPPSVVFCTFVGLLGIASVRATYKVTLMVPTEVLQFFPKYLSLILGVCLALCLAYTTIPGYLYPGALALVNIAPPLLNLRLAGIIFGLLSWFVSVALNQSLTFQHWVYYSGLVAGGLTGVILSDYYAIRFQRLPLEGLYRLTHALRFCGFNLPALMALAAGYATLAAAGVIRAVTGMPEVAEHYYEIASWGLPFVVSFLAYAILAKICCYGPARSPTSTAGSKPSRRALGTPQQQQQQQQQQPGVPLRGALPGSTRGQPGVFILNASTPDVPRRDDATIDAIVHIHPTGPTAPPAMEEEAKEYQYQDNYRVAPYNTHTTLPLYDIHGHPVEEKTKM